MASAVDYGYPANWIYNPRTGTWGPPAAPAPAPAPTAQPVNPDPNLTGPSTPPTLLGAGGVPITTADVTPFGSPMDNGHGGSDVTDVARAREGAAALETSYFDNNQQRTAPQTATPGAIPVTSGVAPTVGTAAQSAIPTVARASDVAPPPSVLAQQIKGATIAPVERYQGATVAPTAGAQATALGAASVDQSAANQFRQGQSGLVDQLQAAAAGTVPSAAELQLKRGSEDAVASQLATAAMQHGYGSLAAGREAGRNIAQLQQKNNLDTAQTRAAEQATARSQLGTALEGARGQDINIATTNAGNQQQSQVVGAQLGTQVSISNADRAAARAMKDADLQQAAAAGNAAAQNELNDRQAQLTQAASTTNAANALDASKTNQGAVLSATEANASAANSLKQLQAQIASQGGIANAAQQNDMTKLQAQLQEQTSLANADAANVAARLQSTNQLTAGVQNLDAKLKQEGLDDTARQAQLSAYLDSQREAIGWDKAAAVISADKDAAWKAFVGNLLDSVAGGTAKAVAASDRRVKRNVQAISDQDAHEFLGTIGGHHYEYKDPKKHGEGEFSGPMAQELEKSRMGRQAVKTASDGTKMVDGTRLALALASAVAQVMRPKVAKAKGGAGLSSLLDAEVIRSRKDARR